MTPELDTYEIPTHDSNKSHIEIASQKLILANPFAIGCRYFITYDEPAWAATGAGSG